MSVPEQAQRSDLEDLVEVGYLVLTAVVVGLYLYELASSPDGQMLVARVKAWWKAKGEGCQPCQQRRAMLQEIKRRTNHVLFDAEQIVEGADVETYPEPPDAA